MVFASLATKDPPGMLEPFRGVIAEVHTVPIGDHASFAPDELAQMAAALGFRARAHEHFAQALKAIPSDARVLIFGSLYLAGEVLAANGETPD